MLYNLSMNKNNYQLEVLAPVGNRESFFAAINNGVDAVYLGIRDFNARNNIQNFSLHELEEIVNYAHLFDVKVYLTFNILIKNEEIRDALNIIKNAYMLGVDAFIVQDIGIATLMKKFFPDITLHASTQMGVHNLEGAKFVEKLGFKRVVLSRETPLDEIKRIHEETNLEIEYFVQGALCIAFSGNCYLCSLLTGNSGNRGKCQQFCRLPYTMKLDSIQESGYLLSTKDFCMLPALKELADAGVISFKIEGRARRVGYIAGATKIYKKAIENNFKFTKEDIDDLKKLFNRGDYTKGYFEDSKILYPSIQGHKGLKIGKVINFITGKKFNIIEIEANHEISSGDGLKFIKNDKEIGSIGAQDVKKDKNRFIITTTSKVEVGADVYLTLDSKMEEGFLQNRRRLEVKAVFNAKIGEKPCLKFSYKNIEVCVYGEDVLLPAKNQPLKKEDVLSQISKLTDTPFALGDLDICLEDVFMAKSQLNSLRREVSKKLLDEIIKNNKKQRICRDFDLNITKNNHSNDKIVYIFDDLSKLNDLSQKIDIAVYSPKTYLRKSIQEFDLICREKNIEGALDTPIFATEMDIVFLKECLKNTLLKIVANNYYAFDITSIDNIIIGMGLNVYNNFSCKFYEDLGAKDIFLSRELKPYELNEFISGVNLYYYTNGRDEYMTLKSCPFKEHIGGSCENCKYKEGLVYKMQSGKELLVERKKMVSCQFVIKSENMRDINEYTKVNKIKEIH